MAEDTTNADEPGGVAPTESLPARSAAAPRRPSLVGPGWGDRWRARAERREQAQAMRGAVAGAALGVLLLVLGSLPLGRAQIFRDNGLEGPGPWAGSLATLVLLLVALQLVLVLLALEHRAQASRERASRERAGRERAGRAQGGGSTRTREERQLWWWRAGVVISVLVALAVGLGWSPTWAAFWDRPGLQALGFQLLALAGIVWADRVLEHPLAPDEDRWRADLGALEPPAPTSLTAPDRLVAIGASGGGIRAAAYVLGGHQAVQDAAPALGVAAPVDEPHVFAVSGGSYIGTALALRRAYDEHGRPRSAEDPQRSWRSAYSMSSPELERLRRHTRYLYEPAGRAADGLVSLVTGALVNLAIVAVMLRLLAWLSVQLGVTSTFVSTLERDACGQLPGLGLACGWGVREWLALLAPAWVAVLLVAWLTYRGWRATAAFDDDDEDAAEDEGEPRTRVLTGEQEGAARSDREEARGWLSRVETLRPLLLLAAAGWLVLTVAIPGAAVGVARMVTSNQPTAGVAAVLHSAGFATEEMCREAIATNVARAAERAESEARISPGRRREASAGACGVETTVSRIVDTRGTPTAADDVVVAADEDREARSLVGSVNLTGSTATVAVLLLLVLVLLRRGPSPEAIAQASPWTRVKRTLLTWAPLVIVGSVAVYVLLVWSFGLIANMSIGYRGYAAMFTVGGFALAFLMDANATSMHGFYRSRLSSAFAVTVDRHGVAEELPAEEVYRFSDLAGGPRLHVVATVNTQEPHEAPTMRGGFPLVLGPERVELFRERHTRISVPTRDYERYAGPGRVSMMAAMAISGAAISPLMGRYAVQMAPYRLLLALFNLRVGSWVRNPMHTDDRPGPRQGWDSWMWMSQHPGMFNVIGEGIGRTSADGRWVYLSDGGHLDNTGLVECVRHCVITGQGGRVLVIDASNDPVGSWAAVGDAVAVIRSDLAVDLRRTQLAGPGVDPLPPWARRYSAPGLDVLVVKAVRTPSDPEDAELRRWWDVLPPSVQSFQQLHADFPRSSTARQKFGDLEFEAYRALGFVSVSCAVTAAGWVT